jgi:hypothetical protein
MRKNQKLSKMNQLKVEKLTKKVQRDIIPKTINSNEKANGTINQ